MPVAVSSARYSSTENEPGGRAWVSCAMQPPPYESGSLATAAIARPVPVLAADVQQPGSTVVRGVVSRHRPTIPAGLEVNRLPSRMYFLTMSAERWPVWDMITRSEAPAAAAEVANPARKLWPA